MSVSHEIKRLGLLSRSSGKYSLKTYHVDRDALDRLVAREEMERNSGRAIMRYREDEERLQEAALGDVLQFSVDDLSPYKFPLDGDTYDPDPIYGPRGTCPLCNNERSAEVDAYFIEHFHSRTHWGVHAGYRFNPRLVLEHLVNHVGLIYASALESSELKSGGANGEWPLEKRIGMVIRSMEVYKRRRARQDRDLGDMAIFEPHHPRQDVEPGPSVYGRPDGHGGRAKEWYAYSGGQEIGALRPWGDRRVAQEIQKKSREAIVFYDEMLDVRERARRVYDEIMDTDIDALNEEKQRQSNGKAAYVERNYSAAIAAAREIKGVAMDMAKLALIATKYGDEKDKVRQISPSMKSMLDDLGIFDNDEADDARVVEPEAEDVAGIEHDGAF